MKNNWLSFIKGVLIVVFATLEEFFGGFDMGIGLLLGLIVIDFVLGFLYAVINKQVSSTEMKKGFIRKCVEFMLILLCYRLDVVFGLLDPEKSSIFQLRMFACVYFGMEEGISILENSAKLGVPLPKRVLKILKQVPNALGDSFSKTLVDVLSKWLHIDLKNDDKKKKETSATDVKEDTTENKED